MYADKVAACKTEVAGALETFHNARAMRVAQFPLSSPGGEGRQRRPL